MDTRWAYRQPCHALEPDAFLLETAEQWALNKASCVPLDRFCLTSFWYVDLFRQHVPGERNTRYRMRIAQAENYGIACGLTSAPQDFGHAFIGKDTREILKDRLFRDDVDRTALIDLVFANVLGVASDRVILDQTLRDKYALRSRLFADEAEKVLRRKGAPKARKPFVVVIGATAGIIAELVTRGFEVAATDMSQDVVGQQLGGVTVCGETENVRLIKAADLVIITAMTFPNRTLPALMEAAKAWNTSTIIWAITGKNFGQYYVEHGIDCVISDPSPFLFLPGTHSIEIWRRTY